MVCYVSGAVGRVTAGVPHRPARRPYSQLEHCERWARRLRHTVHPAIHVDRRVRGRSRLRGRPHQPLRVEREFSSAAW